jgi:hypothetical protein
MGSSSSDKKRLLSGTGSSSLIFISHGNGSYAVAIFASRSAATAAIFSFFEPWIDLIE